MWLLQTEKEQVQRNCLWILFLGNSRDLHVEKLETSIPTNSICSLLNTRFFSGMNVSSAEIFPKLPLSTVLSSQSNLTYDLNLLVISTKF